MHSSAVTFWNTYKRGMREDTQQYKTGDSHPDLDIIEI